jgi:endonuclease/exonuclease/phosphatase family metal-dependent hydrolase
VVRALVISCAFAYPLALLTLALMLYFVGETWWVTAAGLYVPRLAFATPLPIVVLLLGVSGLGRYWWSQLVAAFLVVVPLMGFGVPKLSAARTGAPTLRVLSFNVNSGFAGPRPLVDQIAAASADVVLLQETPPGNSSLVEALRARFLYVESSSQFIVASRGRIISSTEPRRLSVCGRLRSPRFMRYSIETPLGPITFYSVHPVSPRGVLHLRQLRPALHQLKTGELFAGDPEGDVLSNATLRARQIEAVADEAASEAGPVLIAGDTNLPGLSAVSRKHLARFTDGFQAASWGFGYTYPSEHPFLRLDRILVTDKLRFASFRVACKGVSDHLCVVAEIQATP